MTKEIYCYDHSSTEDNRSYPSQYSSVSKSSVVQNLILLSNWQVRQTFLSAITSQNFKKMRFVFS